jgi:hypothetical protein
MDSIEALFTALALATSVVSLAVSWYTHRDTARASARPVLIFSARTDSLWQVQNVGNGPALDVLVGDRNESGQYPRITGCYPLAAGASASLTWQQYPHGWAATYADIFGNVFTTVCADHKNNVYGFNRFAAWRPVTSEWLYRWSDANGQMSRVTDADLGGRPEFDLDVMRNEIVARHGYIFSRPDLKVYFDAQEWYSPLTSDMESVKKKLSASDRATMKFIYAYQMRRKVTAVSER